MLFYEDPPQVNTPADNCLYRGIFNFIFARRGDQYLPIAGGLAQSRGAWRIVEDRA